MNHVRHVPVYVDADANSLSPATTPVPNELHLSLGSGGALEVGGLILGHQ